MSISSWDDFPVHQTSEYIRHAATSDRNFYDRYYFNMHSCSDEVFAIFGFGQYPNLGVTDAFLCIAHGDDHQVVRASRPLTDRMDLQVGPIRVEVLEPLRKIRFVCEPNDESDLSMDATWDGAIPAFEEPRQVLRVQHKEVFNTQRFVQVGRWTGSLRAGDQTWDATPDRYWGARDRSWGVRPVGEPEPDGIRQGVNAMAGMWNYFPMQFDDHAIVYMVHEQPDGSRRLEEGVRVWSDPERPIEHLGRPEHEHRMRSGTRMLAGSTIRFPDAGIAVECTPLMVNYVSLGTGYGMDQDWRHGLYQGPDLVVQGVDHKISEIAGLAQYGVVDQVARFEYDGNTGHGLYEHGFFGPFPAAGLHDRGDVAP